MGTTTEKFDYAFETKSKLKDTINKIENTLTEKSTFRSYPQKLFKGYIDVLNNGTESLWDNLDKISGSGTEIILENTEASPMKVLLSGNTIQNGTPTVQSPIPIRIVTGNNIISVSGENQIDKTDYPIDLVAENLFDKDDARILRGYVYVSDKGIKTSNFDYSVIVKVKPSTKYIATKMANNPEKQARFRLCTATNYPQMGGARDNVCNQVISNDTATELSITTESNDNYLVIFCYNLNSTTTLNEMLGSLVVREAEPIYKEMCEEDYFYKQNDKWYIHKGFGKVTDESGSTSITISDMVSDAKIYSYYGGTVSGNTITYDEAISDTNYIYYPLQTPIEEEITNTTLIKQLEAIFKAKSSDDKTYISQTNEDLPFKLSVEAIKKYE